MPVLEELLPRLVGERGEVWLADPGRPAGEPTSSCGSASAGRCARRTTPRRRTSRSGGCGRAERRAAARRASAARPVPPGHGSPLIGYVPGAVSLRLGGLDTPDHQDWPPASEGRRVARLSQPSAAAPAEWAIRRTSEASETLAYPRSRGHGPRHQLSAAAAGQRAPRGAARGAARQPGRRRRGRDRLGQDHAAARSSASSSAASRDRAHAAAAARGADRRAADRRRAEGRRSAARSATPCGSATARAPTRGSG